MLSGIILILSSTTISAISQLLLKLSARRRYPVWWREYVNLFVIAAYTLFLVATLFSALALRYIPLTLSTALGASGQIIVPVVSYLFLHEKIGKRKCAGMAIITVGILIFAL